MPLTKKGKEIMKSMKEQYGDKKGESIFYASKNKGTIKGVEKASKGKMMKVKEVKGALEKASKLHAAQAKTLGTVLKAAGGKMMGRPMMAKVGVKVGRDTAKKLKEARKRRKADVIKGMGGYMGGGLKEATKKLKAQGYKGGNMALKKIPEGPKGEGLRKLKAERPDVTRKMGFAKKGKVMKAMAGKSVRGFGAARTSGMGLQDEQMVPGKSMDYYNDLM